MGNLRFAIGGLRFFMKRWRNAVPKIVAKPKVSRAAGKRLGGKSSCAGPRKWVRTVVFDGSESRGIAFSDSVPTSGFGVLIFREKWTRPGGPISKAPLSVLT